MAIASRLKDSHHPAFMNECNIEDRISLQNFGSGLFLFFSFVETVYLFSVCGQFCSGHLVEFPGHYPPSPHFELFCIVFGKSRHAQRKACETASSF
ncbi:hypothetical protein CEXT_139691 [Caerostris extrusa]|uniref:Uncharacterized protein n=1 Tax=Caerostris extrusa TaxID=172846 RepID=A0AAV4R8H9_CAEEX|nr:hypothetical protein CEXT_139691 [Caerostris extrusa]